MSGRAHLGKCISACSNSCAVTPRAAPHAAELARLAREHDLNLWHAFGVFLGGWAKSESGAALEGVADMRRGVGLLREQDVLNFDGLIKIGLVQAEAKAGDSERAI